MANRINELFKVKKRNILSVFFTAGFPRLEDTITIAAALEEAGADLIEIGIPFSDPVADGTVIQESNKISLANGMTVSKLLDQVREIRKSVSMPIVLMGYLNPIYQFGLKRFCEEASAAGVDGLILPDLPLQEYEKEWKTVCEACNLAVTFLVAPATSEERLKRIDELSNGFIYAVSASSTTGRKDDFTADQENYFKRLTTSGLKNEVLIGFGISNETMFRKASNYAAGAIVGSAFISMLGNSKNVHSDIHQFVKNIKGAV